MTCPCCGACHLDGPRACVREVRAELDRLRAELYRLRRLPVIKTCGECGHVGFGDYCSHPRFDGMEKHDRPELSQDAAPPEWCPLRGGR